MSGPKITVTPRSTRVNMNREELERARTVTTYKRSAKLKKSSELVGDVAARDYLLSEYRGRARPIEMVRSNGVPVFDNLLDVGGGEYVVAEAKANQSPFGKTNRVVFQASEQGVVGTRIQHKVVDQFSPEWFQQRLTELRRDFGHDGRVLAAKLEASWRSGKIRALKIRAPIAGMSAEHVVIEDVSRSWNAHVGASPAHTLPTRPVVSAPAIPGSSGVPSQVERGLEIAQRQPVLPHGTSAPRASTAMRAAEAGVDVARATTRSRVLAVGLKTWRAVRRIGSVAIVCFVPLTVLDVLFEIAMRLWDREREKEEKRRLEKQRTLQEVLRQKHEEIERATRAIAADTAHVQAIMDAWQSARVYNPFVYARITATVVVETFESLYTGEAIDSLSKYRVETVAVRATNWSHEFELSNPEAQAVPKTEDDSKALMAKGIYADAATRKLVRRKTLRYTIVPPVITPFDVVISQINNLYLDIARFVGWFSNSEDSILDGVEGFNFTNAWDEQLALALQYPAPLRAETCKYCLAYLFNAARFLSRHPLQQEDIHGNGEDPRKGWKRRFRLLQGILHGIDSKHGKTFDYFTWRVKELARPGSDPEIAKAMQSLFEGARAILYSLERIEREYRKPEYYYFGPSFRPDDE
jgi:hypothetical protein